MNKRKSPTRLTMPQTLQLASWLQKNKELLEKQGAPSIAKQAKLVLGFEVSTTTVYNVGGEVGYKFNGSTAPKLHKLIPIIVRMCEEMFGADHELTEQVRAMLPPPSEE